MEDQLKEVKTILRSLVVSSPVQVDMRSLLRDYRNMIGAPLPYIKYGYRDPLAFLKERCNDCFHLTGSPTNPSLILIVPDSIKHIDSLVQKQRISTPAKHMKGKRISVPESIKTTRNEKQHDSIYQSFFTKNIGKSVKKNTPDIRQPDTSKNIANNTEKQTNQMNNKDIRPPDTNKNIANNIYRRTNQINSNGTQRAVTKTETIKDIPNSDDSKANNKSETEFKSTSLRKRLSSYNSQHQNSELSSNKGSSQDEHDSGRLTSSSNGSIKRVQLEELKNEIYDLIKEHKNGILSSDLMGLYRERYNRPLEPSRGGYKDLNGVLGTLVGRVAFRASGGHVRLYDAECEACEAARAAPVPVTRQVMQPRWDADMAADPGDALPGVAYDPDVFPSDCMSFNESIARLSIDDVRVGDMLDAMVGEVYSPTHFWLMRLGDHYNVALDNMMDDMTEYYSTGEGRSRWLSRGAVRRGQYCCSLFERDWHRSLIVNVLDSDTVKVRQVDYGTVDTVDVSSLKPLLRRWAALPAQAVRARLAGLRPGAGARRWPHAAAHAFLHRIRDKRLVANVAATDHEENTLEVFLIDTSGPEDVCIARELIRAGHADPRPDSALTAAAREGYLYPRFEALESGDTPNFGDIARYIRDDIALEYVDAYRRHVLEPACSPPPPAIPAPPHPVLRPTAPEFHPACSPEHSAPPAPAEPACEAAAPRLADPQQWLRAELNTDPRQSEPNTAHETPPRRPSRPYGAFDPSRCSALLQHQDSDPRHTPPDQNHVTPDPQLSIQHVGSSSQSSPLGQHYSGSNRHHSSSELNVGADVRHLPPVRQYFGSTPQNHPPVHQYSGSILQYSPRQHRTAHRLHSQTSNNQYSGSNGHHNPPIQHYTNSPSLLFGGSNLPHNPVDQQSTDPSNGLLNPSQHWGQAELSGCWSWTRQQLSGLMSQHEYNVWSSVMKVDPTAADSYMLTTVKDKILKPFPPGFKSIGNAID